MARLPKDDDFLDELEVEGLVTSSVQTSTLSKSPNRLSPKLKRRSRKPIYWAFSIALTVMLGMVFYTHRSVKTNVISAPKNNNNMNNDSNNNKNSSKNSKGDNNNVNKGDKGGKNNNSNSLKDWTLTHDDDDDEKEEQKDDDTDKKNNNKGKNDKGNKQKADKIKEDNKVDNSSNEDDDDENYGVNTSNDTDNSYGNNESNQQSTDTYSDDYTLNVNMKEETEQEKEERVESLIDKWGKWHFWDGAEEIRPTEDYLSMYPNKDCPYEGFPDESWQADAVYVNHMLDSALELLVRVKEAIFTEYGFGPKEEISTDQYMTRVKMFKLNVVDFHKEDADDKIKDGLQHAGWTTTKSFEGMKRRLLHSMMTNDAFKVVMGGNSAAAGLGNHFQQSYLAQFEYIMKPVLERLGVELVTMNLANTEIGTISDALGSGSIYGDNIDMIIWDSNIDNGGDNDASIDLFYRQALLAGKRPPILVGTPAATKVLKQLHLTTDADILVLGNGMGSLPRTSDTVQAKSMPQAVRYLNCTEGAKNLCEHHKFNARCWIPRDDVTPPTKQLDQPRYQVENHPGFRQHQLKGRIFVFLVLELLASALNEWGDVTIVEGNPLDGEYWHLTDYYSNIQTKVKNLDESDSFCSNLKQFLPQRVCSTPLQARTEVTPRANPTENNIISIIQPAGDGLIPSLSTKMLYEGPDVPNPSLMIPSDEINVHDIIINRRRELFGWQPNFEYDFDPKDYASPAIDKTGSSMNLRRRVGSDEIVTGKDWKLDTLPGTCDGTTTAICGRLPTSDCLLSGHMIYNGGLIGNEFSNWLVMKLSGVAKGILIIKVETDALSDNFTLDYAIDGTITSLSKDLFNEKMKIPQDKVGLLTLLDDASVATKDETKNIQFAVRVKNCNKKCKFKLTHVYWA